MISKKTFTQERDRNRNKIKKKIYGYLEFYSQHTFNTPLKNICQIERILSRSLSLFNFLSVDQIENYETVGFHCPIIFVSI